MEEPHVEEQPAHRRGDVAGSRSLPPVPANRAGSVLAAQAEGGPCPGCGAGPDGDDNGPTTQPYVYALGRIEPRFPSLAVEKEFAQATGRAATAGLTDRQAYQQVLAERSNRYLVRQLCWV